MRIADRLAQAIVLLTLSCASIAAPPGRVVRIGLLYPVSPDFNPAKNSFDYELVEGLRELGYRERSDVVFELRSAAGNPPRLPKLAAELVAAKVDVIVAPGTQPPLVAAQATKTIPIVMVGASDPVEIGMVASLAKPGGNVTGLAVNASEIAAKRVQLLREALPGITRVAVLWNSSIKSMSLGYQLIEDAAPKLGVSLQSVQVSSSEQFDRAFAAIARGRPQGMIVLFGPLRGDDLPRIVDFVVKHNIPTLFELGQGIRGGGLMEFGPSPTRAARRAAYYIDRIANGTPPSQLPIEQPTVFELVINARAAKSMGIALPPSLLLRADRVVE
jgi:putative tryptophan/tyrosine transport system substrate-binding protein